MLLILHETSKISTQKIALIGMLLTLISIGLKLFQFDKEISTVMKH